MISKTYLAAAAAGLLVASGFAKADTLAQWTFESNLSGSVNGTTGIAALPAIAPETAAAGFTATFTGSHANSSKWYTGAGYQASVTGLYSTGWAVNDSYEIDSASLANYSNITLSFAQSGSNTGPSAFQIQYSTDGVNFQNAAVSVTESDSKAGGPFVTTNGSYVVPNGDTGSTTSAISLATSSAHAQGEIFFTVDLSSLSNIVAIRLVDTSTTSIVGTTNQGSVVAAGGTSRIDDITLTGTASAAVPEPASLGMLALGAVGMIARRRRA